MKRPAERKPLSWNRKCIPGTDSPGFQDGGMSDYTPDFPEGALMRMFATSSATHMQ